MVDLEKIRKQFPITNEKIYLAHASRGPLPKFGAEAIQRYIHDSMYSGQTLVNAGVPEDAGKSLFAQLIGAQKSEIALVENTSIGINIVADIISRKKRGNVVTTDYEYSSVTYPFLRKEQKIEVRFVKNSNGIIHLHDIESSVDDSTLAVVISHVHWLNGFRHNLKELSEIAHEHSAYLVVDAVQSAGAMKIDVKRDGIDFLSTGCYKWLCSPPGSGFLYVREELVDYFEPPIIGWRSSSGVKDRDHLTLKFPDDARRFEVGAPAYISLVAAAENIKLLLGVGKNNVEKRILMLSGYLRESLVDMGLYVTTPESASSRSGIVNFTICNPKNIVNELQRKNIVPCGARKDWMRCSPIFKSTIRVAPHFYNTIEEIDAFIESIKEFL
jgi:selenocysteine lyase/cysteine desulfurase